jgi:hypothetical protein
VAGDLAEDAVTRHVDSRCWRVWGRRTTFAPAGSARAVVHEPVPVFG